MADAALAPQINEVHIQAVQSVEEYLNGLAAVRMPATQLSQIGEAYVAGWSFDVCFSDMRVLALAISVTATFPFSLPRMVILNPPALLTWPHLEENGVLCVYQPQTSFSTERPADVVQSLIREGVALIERNILGEINDDFRAEFVSYWNRTTEVSPQVWSLVEPVGSHRTVFVWKGDDYHIIGESEALLLNWMTRKFGKARSSAPRSVKPALLLWLLEVPTPNAFPKNGADVRKLFANDDVALELLGKSISDGTIDEVLLGVRTVNGVGFGSVKIILPPRDGGLGRKQDPIQRGFRPGHLPVKFAVQRGLAVGSKIKRMDVQRIDHDWVHGRDQDRNQTLLKKSRIVIVGVGSLGSSLAELLAKAGVGSLFLIDGEVLTWENICRHALGASSVRMAKSTQLANAITSEFPHLNSIEGKHTVIGNSDLPLLQSADLIVATTGTWQVDSMLNSFQQTRGLPPILYGWLEPHAAAAHTVIIPSTNACLRCGMSETGTPALSVTQWPAEGLFAVPACGGMFTPYGAAELTWAHALLASESLRCLLSKPTIAQHKIWVGQTMNLDSLGGSVAQGWIETMGDPGAGGMIRERDWPKSPECPICAKIAEFL